MKLRYMLTGSDEEFAQRVREAVKRRARFETRKGVVETFTDAQRHPRKKKLQQQQHAKSAWR
uniref:Uncharacterized protein n=1 Tax=Arundo donax TaxID=35708 RepID=A0A0A9AZA4_ARUDO